MNPMFLDKQAHKRSWIIVVWTSMGLIASSFCLVLPSAIQTQMAAHFEVENISAYLAIIATIYFLTNTFTPFLSGCIRDGLGDRFGLLFLNATCVLGQLIVTFGVEAKSLLVFGIGRVILGWGIEALLIILTSLIAAYYRQGYFTFMMGIYQWVYTLGFVICIWYAPSVGNVLLANIIALVLQGIGLCTSVIAVQIDSKVEEEFMKDNPKYFEFSQNPKSEILHLEEEEIIEDEKQQEQQQAQQQFQVVRVQSEYPLGEPQQEDGVWQNFLGIREIKSYPSIYWLLLFFYGFNSTSVLVLVDSAADFLVNNWLTGIEDAEGLAWKMVNLMWLITGTVTPLFGYIVDLYGQRSSMTIFSGLMCVWAHFLVLLQQPYDGLLLLGFAYALSYTTVWSAIIYLTKPDSYGKSLSLLVSLQNFGIAISPLIINYLRRYHYSLSSLTQSPLYGELFLMLLATVSFIGALLIHYVDKNEVKLIDRGMNVKSEILSDGSKKDQ